MANIGDKFIITIGDKAENEQSGETLYRIKGFKSLVFDENGIGKLEKYNGNNVKAPTKELELIKQAILIICRNVRPDGDLRYFDWEDRCRMKDIYDELVRGE